MIYLDHAASSWPKPPEVIKAVTTVLEEYGANPGRGGHSLAVRASQTIQLVRQLVAQFICAQEAKNIVFTPSATIALNIALKGYPFQKGDKVIATAFEHNAVRRPLEWLKREKEIDVEYLDLGYDKTQDLEGLREKITPETKMIVVTHASNVTGAIAPLDAISAIAAELGIVLCVDAAQTAGIIPIDVQKSNIHLLALAGHKGLLGPQGVGCLYVHPTIKLSPLIHGGTGTQSFDEDQPSEMPIQLEAGTQNTPGIAGLGEGIRYLQTVGINKIWEHKESLTQYCLAELQKVKGVEIYGPAQGVPRAGVISFNLKGIDSHEVAIILDQHYQIAVRGGVHCAPLAHKALATEDQGAVRVSFGYSNTIEDVNSLIKAVKEIVDGLIGD